jgi:hypothetical protein
LPYERKLTLRVRRQQQCWCSLDSTSGPDCATTKDNVEQDHAFGGYGCRTRYRPGGFICAIVHSLERIDSKGMPTWLLRQQDLLRYIAKEHSSSIATAREGRFSVRVECDMRHDRRSDYSKSGVHQPAFYFDQRDLSRAFSAAARGPLYVSHLIQRR